MASLGRLVAVMFVVLTAPAAAACPQGATCGRVTVPLDHSRATPGTRSIAYAKLPATGTATGTFVLLTGGPGQAAIPFTTRFAKLIRPLRDRYDLLVVDQRGTGGSGAVECPLEARADVAACAARLGAARPFLNTPETAADLEDVRVALGIEQLTLFGVSYGASVAGEYARRYPARTAALVLDSPTPVDGLDGLDALRLYGTPRVLREVCSGDCRRTVPDPERALERALARFPVLEMNVYDALASSDVTPGLRLSLPAAIASLARGDTVPLFHLQDLYEGGPSAGGNVGRLLATDCIEANLPWAPDSPVEGRSDALLAYIHERTEAFAPFRPGTVVGRSLTGFCADWPPTPRPQRAPTAGPDVPVLILSGREDLRTPLESARRTAAQYPRATVVAVPGAGHSVLSTSACALVALGAFLEGSTPSTECPRKTVAAAPYIPASLSALRPTHLPGLRGRLVSAATVTLTGVGYDTLAGRKHFRGLRGGHVYVRANRIELRRVRWIRGVRISGTITPRRAVLTVDGPLKGTVIYAGDRVTARF